MRTLIAVLALAACSGGKSKSQIQPVQPDLSHAGDQVPGAPTGTHVHLSCKGTSTVACQTVDYTFDATYDTPADCRWGGDGALNFTLRSSADANARLSAHITSFNGAGTYQLNTDDDAIDLAASIPASEGACPRAAVTASIRSHKYGCGGCQVTVTDANPSAPYPKVLGLSIGCRSLCQENTFVCTPPLNIQVSQTCSK